MAEEKIPISTFDYYKDKLASDKTALEKLIEDSEELIGVVTTHIMTMDEWLVRSLNRPPPALAFYNPETRECFVIDVPEMGESLPSIWMKLVHEKGHHFEYPRNDWRKLLELAVLSVELKKEGVSDAMPSENSICRPICQDAMNMVEDALVNYVFMFHEFSETSMRYFGWFGKESRSAYEGPLLEMDISKLTPMTTNVEFHHRLMTALGWFYLGADSWAPGGVKKLGIEPYRSLCETTCYKCAKSFATYNFRCPHCNEWNNTVERTPTIKMLSDPISPLYTSSTNKVVTTQYKLLQEYFIWVLKLDWARKQPGVSQDDIFFNRFYRHLASLFARLVKTGSKYVMPQDVPKFLGIQTLSIKVGDKKVNIIENIKPQLYRGRGIFEFVGTCRLAHSKKYEALAKDASGLELSDILPTTSEPIYGVYDPTLYKSLDGWEDKDIEPRTIKKFAAFQNALLNEKWDQDRFDSEFLKFLSTLTEDEKTRAMLVAGQRADSLAQFGIDWDKFVVKMRTGGEK
jgi:hypothetical protein